MNNVIPIPVVDVREERLRMAVLHRRKELDQVSAKCEGRRNARLTEAKKRWFAAKVELDDYLVKTRQSIGGDDE